MFSIIRMKHALVTHELLEAIKSVTLADITLIDVHDDMAFIHIRHHEGPSCPHCGNKIHAYGHGLCFSCWMSLNPTK